MRVRQGLWQVAFGCRCIRHQHCCPTLTWLEDTTGVNQYSGIEDASTHAQVAALQVKPALKAGVTYALNVGYQSLPRCSFSPTYLNVRVWRRTLCLSFQVQRLPLSGISNTDFSNLVTTPTRQEPFLTYLVQVPRRTAAVIWST